MTKYINVSKHNKKCNKKQWADVILKQTMCNMWRVGVLFHCCVSP